MAIFMQGQGEVAGTTASLHAGPGIHSPEAQRRGSGHGRVPWSGLGGRFVCPLVSIGVGACSGVSRCPTGEKYPVEYQ
jgi:hypothetical protein